ncbi:universal stress protein [Dyadobacter sp. CY345]|uniref:universal stress protein n=1 Tax=Dyadobacter sp. CY345 TaxID=2909335 RepID=UPI001F29C95B|nr:universal stress protein [Dyadobacter sp. CY345]MCF2447113.1 universal stress protein [Dyadobacter sp. CY345]
MKKILVAIDFSENARKAFLLAKYFAVKTGAELCIMHATEPNIADLAIPITQSSLPIYQQMEDSLKEQLGEYVVEAEIEGLKAIAYAEKGTVKDAAIGLAAQLGADMIVVGRTGKGGFFDKLIGSSATDIALSAGCPVLIVPPQTDAYHPKNVVYATQLEYEEISILKQVNTLVTQLDGKLSFIKVSSLEQPNIQPDGQFMDSISSELGIDASEINIQKGGGVLEGIEKFCEQRGADLLVVSTRERSFIEQFIINPSLTKKLVLDTKLPLLVYHLNSDDN